MFKPVSTNDIIPCVQKLLDPSKGKISKREWQYLFQDVHKMCTAIPEPRTEELYSALETFLNGHVAQLREEISTRQSDVLKAYYERFEQFYRGAENVDKAFKYMNDEIEKKVTESRKVSYYTRPQSSNKQVFPLSLHTWKTVLFQPLQKRIIHDVLREMQQDREGQSSDLWVVQGVLDSIVKMTQHEAEPLRLYIETFEVPFLADTGEFYHRESDKFLGENDCSSFMRKARARLDEEFVRGQKVLQCDSLNKMMAVCVDKLVTSHQGIMLAECDNYIDRRQVDDLNQMYQLLRRVEQALSPMLSTFEQHVVREGKAMLEALVTGDSSLTPQSYVEAAIALYKKFSSMVQEAFDAEPVFVSALDKACTTVINQSTIGTKQFSSPELLAKFCDSVLKKSAKTASENDLEERLNDLVTVFKYINDKDVFQKFYSRMLAKRLIHNTSVSEEAEESMISRLKQLCGYEYTSKLQRMFTDVSLSGELTTQFQDDRGAEIPFAFRILVLQAGSWPLSAAGAPEFLIPTQLEKCINCFESFYSTRFNGRRLDWMHHLGMADLKANLKSGKYEFTVTEFQLGVLLMFTNTDQLTAKEVQAQCKLPDKEFERTVKSLMACHLLTCSSESPEPSSQLSLNLKFKNRKHKLKLSAAVQKETPQETQQTHKAIGDDRKLFLQASIVRVMKARKTLNFNDLIKEVIDQSISRFKPSVPQIKKCIEELIDKAYLERKENERSQLYYVA